MKTVALLAFLGLSTFTSTGHADCWRFIGEGLAGVVVDYSHPADRICSSPLQGSASEQMLLKLYFQDETIANLIVIKPSGSRHWVVTEERTPQGSFQIPGHEVTLEFPFFKEGEFQLRYQEKSQNFRARLEN